MSARSRLKKVELQIECVVHLLWLYHDKRDSGCVGGYFIIIIAIIIIIWVLQNSEYKRQ